VCSSTICFSRRVWKVSSSEQLYYILDSRTVVGNCAMWWRPEGAGYTAELDEAGLYTKEKAGSLRHTDFLVPKELAEKLAVRHVRLDRLRYENVVAVQFRKLRKDALDALSSDACCNQGYWPCDDPECFLCASDQEPACPNAVICRECGDGG